MSAPATTPLGQDSGTKTRRGMLRGALGAGAVGAGLYGASAANAASPPLPTDDRYVLRERSSVNVKDYGAKGDGTADDTAAIQAAIAAADGLDTVVDEVYFPRGKYLCGTVRLGPFLTLRGVGYGSRIVTKPGTTRLFDGRNLDSITVRDLSFHGNDQNVTVIDLDYTVDSAQYPNGLGYATSHTLDHINIDSTSSAATCVRMKNNGDSTIGGETRIRPRTGGTCVDWDDRGGNLAITDSQLAGKVKLSGQTVSLQSVLTKGIEVVGPAGQGAIRLDACYCYEADDTHVALKTTNPCDGVISSGTEWALGNGWIFDGPFYTMTLQKDRIERIAGTSGSVFKPTTATTNALFLDGGKCIEGWNEPSVFDAPFVDIDYRYFLVVNGGIGQVRNYRKGFVELAELSADAAIPAADRVRCYARDDGTGKTQLCVRFPSGLVKVLASDA